MTNLLLFLILLWLLRLERQARSIRRQAGRGISLAARHEIQRLAVQAGNVIRMLGGGQHAA